MKKKRGRPKKNKDLNLNVTNSSYNINYNNIFPPVNIVSGKSAEIIKNTDILGILGFSDQHVFETLMDVFKGNEKELNIVFTKSGLLLSPPYKDEQKDMVRFEAKIFPDKLGKYQMSSLEDQAFRVNIKNFLDIIKVIPKDVPFDIRLHKIEDKKYCRVWFKRPESDHCTDIVVTLGHFMGYDPIKQKNNEKYDAIFMMEAAEFERVCKRTIKPFSSTVDIECIYRKGKTEVSFKCVKDNIDIQTTFKPNPKFAVLQTPKKELITGKFNISSFLKYTKCCKLSTVVKLYFSTNKPLIIEYDIKSQLGTLQIFVQPQFSL